ncbi:MAG: hypothetical protein IJ593_04180, partial [Lachnospiraceae bacterium]|nr:hypothetical protein [Lachnospiraceae bacterium]
MIRRFLKIIICSIIMAMSFNMNVFAEVKTADFVLQEKKGDLQVLFTFDKEVVDIEFISPSGKTFNKSNALYENGDLWSSYRIVDAEIGQWKVSYDKKTNEYIDYSIADNNQGLWAQYFTINSISDDTANLSFRFDDENSNGEYDYEISAFDIVASSSIVIFENKAASNQDITVDTSLYELPSGEYKLIMNAWKEIGAAEIFDSIETETFIYDNPHEPAAIDNFRLSVYPDNHKINVNWYDSRKENKNTFKVTFYEDDKFVLSDDYDSSVSSAEFLYNGDTKKIKVDVQYEDGAIWSKRCSKEVVLNDNYLHIDNDVTNSKTLNLKYRVKNEAKINIYNVLNKEETNLDVSGEGSYLIDLLDGNNNISAIMSLDDSINYIIYDDYYYSGLTPTIRLFENINGKVFNSNKVSIIGEAKNADSLQINSNEVELKDGVFDAEVTLDPGENIFEILATKNNGSASKMIIRLYRRGTTFDSISLDDFKSSIKKYIPLFISLFVSLIIIIISLFKIKKVDTERVVKNSNSIVLNIIALLLLFAVEGLLCFYYIKRLRFSNSLEFLDIIENSVKDAAVYLNYNKKILIAIIIVSIFILIN